MRLLSILVSIAILNSIATLTFEPASQADSTQRLYKYPKHQTLDLDGELFGLCMALLTMRQTGGSYYLSKEKMKVVPLINQPPLGLKDTTLYALHLGFVPYLQGEQDRVFDLETGQEENLKKWVLNQKDNSISPAAIYLKGLELSGGNVWNALLVVHQLLRNSARFNQFPRYQYKSTTEESNQFFNKFVDLRGDLSERGRGFLGDHPGGWYRIWAGALLRMFLTEDDYFNTSYTGTLDRCPRTPAAHGLNGKLESLKEWYMHGWLKNEELEYDDNLDALAKNSATIDGINNTYRHGEPDRRKARLNRDGSTAAGWLLKGLKNPDLIYDRHLTYESCLAGKVYIRVHPTQ